MQISIKREDLLKPLNQVAGIVERRQTLPILSNILIRCNKDGVTITGTDLEIEVISKVNTSDNQPGEATLPARKLLDICRALPSDAVIKIIIDGEKAIITSGKSRFTLMTLPAGDFPNLETSEWDLTLDVAQKDLKILLERTQFCMAQQDVRYYLNGLLLEFSGKILRAVGTDGHRLGISEITLKEDSGENKQVILPRKGVHELIRFLETVDDTVKLSINPNHIHFELDGLSITSKLIDGRFPDYHKVIPTSQSKHIKLERDVFKDALNRAAILSNEKYRGIRFNFTPESLTISAHNPDQEEAQEEVAIEYNGDELEIGFNSNYFIEAVSALNGNEIIVGLNDTNSSGVLNLPGDTTTKYVVMPMRL